MSKTAIDERTLAEWWCALNCWHVPAGLDLPDHMGGKPIDREQALYVAYHVVTALGGREVGIRLWRERLRAGLNAGTGQPDDGKSVKAAAIGGTMSTNTPDTPAAPPAAGTFADAGTYPYSVAYVKGLERQRDELADLLREADVAISEGYVDTGREKFARGSDLRRRIAAAIERAEGK